MVSDEPIAALCVNGSSREMNPLELNQQSARSGFSAALRVECWEDLVSWLTSESGGFDLDDCSKRDQRDSARGSVCRSLNGGAEVRITKVLGKLAPFTRVQFFSTKTSK